MVRLKSLIFNYRPRGVVWACIKSFYFFQLIPIVGVALNGANVVGYVKCRKDAGTKIRSMAGQFIGQQLMKQV